MISKDNTIGFSLALFNIAKEENKIKKFYKESQVIVESLEENDEIFSVIDDICLSFEKKKQIITNIYKKNDKDLINTMYILAEKNKFRYILDILKNLIVYLQEALNIREGIIYSTIKMSDVKIKEFEKKVSKHFNSNITLKNYLDHELIGGFKIVVNDTIIEDSIKSELEDIKQKLLNNK